MPPVSHFSVLYCDVISYALSVMVLIAMPRLLELSLCNGDVPVKWAYRHTGILRCERV